MTSRAPRAVVCGVDRSDGSRAAARVAAALAERLDLPLELLHVCERDRSPEHGVIHAVQLALEENGEDADARVRIESGQIAERLAAAGADSLLVVGADPSPGLRGALFGTVADAVARDPDGLVVVVPRDAATALEGRTVACGVRDERDVGATRSAAGIAAALGLPVTLLHVVAPQPVVAGVGAAVAPAELAPPAETQNIAERVLASVAEALPRGPDTRVLHGLPGPELLTAAEDEQAAILALGASDRSPLAAACAGSASRYARRHADRPVLLCPR